MGVSDGLDFRATSMFSLKRRTFPSQTQGVTGRLPTGRAACSSSL
jgi:hypothetical protein